MNVCFLALVWSQLKHRVSASVMVDFPQQLVTKVVCLVLHQPCKIVFIYY